MILLFGTRVTYWVLGLYRFCMSERVETERRRDRETERQRDRACGLCERGEKGSIVVVRTHMGAVKVEGEGQQEKAMSVV